MFKPKEIYEAENGLWDLAKEEYPADKVSHFFVLIIYMMVFYGLLHSALHGLNIWLNKRYQKLNRAKQGNYRSNIVSIINSFVSVAFSTLAMFYVCGDG